MKKYLLLAATAMLFSTNAMADNSVNSEVGVSISISSSCSISKTHDMDFGAVVLDNVFSSDATLLMEPGGTITTSSESIVDHDDAGTVGGVEIACGPVGEGDSAVSVEITTSWDDDHLSSSLDLYNDERGSVSSFGSTNGSEDFEVIGSTTISPGVNGGSHYGTAVVTLSY